MSCPLIKGKNYLISGISSERKYLDERFISWGKPDMPPNVPVMAKLRTLENDTFEIKNLAGRYTSHKTGKGKVKGYSGACELRVTDETSTQEQNLEPGKWTKVKLTQDLIIAEKRGRSTKHRFNRIVSEIQGYESQNSLWGNFVEQKGIENCYLLAVLNALSNNPKTLKELKKRLIEDFKGNFLFKLMGRFILVKRKEIRENAIDPVKKGNVSLTPPRGDSPFMLIISLAWGKFLQQARALQLGAAQGDKLTIKFEHPNHKTLELGRRLDLTTEMPVDKYQVYNYETNSHETIEDLTIKDNTNPANTHLRKDSTTEFFVPAVPRFFYPDIYRHPVIALDIGGRPDTCFQALTDLDPSRISKTVNPKVSEIKKAIKQTVNGDSILILSTGDKKVSSTIRPSHIMELKPGRNEDNVTVIDPIDSSAPFQESIDDIKKSLLYQDGISYGGIMSFNVKP